MSRLVDLPVRRVHGANGVLTALVWNRRTRTVAACLERWRECGEWWEGEAEREVERILLADGALIEISAPLAADGTSAPKAGWRIDTLFD